MTLNRSLRPLPIDKGDLVADKYRVERVINSRGKSSVAEATHQESGEHVALRLPGFMHAMSEHLAIFRDAARHATLLRGDRSERLMAIGALRTGEPFMTTELLDGVDLATQLERSGALPVEEAVDVAIQACEALAGVHAAGVLHCDVRPGKLFMTTRDGAPFLIVLTSMISCLHGPSGQPRAQVRLDPRTDIFSLGVTLCELLAGKPLVSVIQWPTSPSGRVYSTLRRHSPREMDLPSDLIPILEKACALDPYLRYDSMASFARALAPSAPLCSQPVLDRLCGPGRR